MDFEIDRVDRRQTWSRVSRQHQHVFNILI